MNRRGRLQIIWSLTTGVARAADDDVDGADVGDDVDFEMQPQFHIDCGKTHSGYEPPQNS